MEQHEIIEFYSREDIGEEIFALAHTRELVGRYISGGYAKRPNTLLFPSDVVEMAKQNISSFHVSCEHWSNPMMLSSGMSKKELESLRIGWDFIFDLDALDFELSKIVAVEIVKYLKVVYGIEDVFIKFSGNKGWHIGVPFESFYSGEGLLGDQPIGALFPQSAHKCAHYLMTRLKPLITKKFEKIVTLKEYSEILGKPVTEIDPWKAVEVDTLVMTQRHLYRAPYSLNEKSGLVSLPIPSEENVIMNFKKTTAEFDKIKVKDHFLPIPKNENWGLALEFLDDAFAYKGSFIPLEVKKTEEQAFKPVIYENKIAKSAFPPCIIEILKGIDDGKKRSEFILRNFLTSVGWKWNEIEPLLMTWNKLNKQPLPNMYLKQHIAWHKKQKRDIMPPQCENETYYVSLGVCHPDNICKKIKNPISYPKFVENKADSNGQQRDNIRHAKGSTEERKKQQKDPKT